MNSSGPQKNEIVEDVEAAFNIIQKSKSLNGAPASDISSLSTSLTRITARLAMQALGYVDFHHMDDDLAEGKIDARYVPAVKRSVNLASPELFPAGLRTLASTLKGHLAKLDDALLQNNLDKAKHEAHEAHEKYHELQTKVAEWLA